MNYRHELKYELNYADLLELRQRLGAVMESDPHAKDGKYLIRSLYFDTPSDKALREKLDGVNEREKFRIRFYNGCTDIIHLERKSKLGGLGSKQTASVTSSEAQAIVNGEYGWMKNHPHGLVREMYTKINAFRLRPKVIVDYIREPFVFRAGNVRVTLDHNIRVGFNFKDFLDAKCVTIPAAESTILLEVKWDAFLPDIIKDAVFINGRRVGAFSKYAQCRIYG